MVGGRTWLETHTFHHRQFADLEGLVRRKDEQGLTLSLCVPTLNEERTIGPTVSLLREELQRRHPLLDEIAIVDSGSSDRTPEMAAAAGAAVYRAEDILPELGRACGKGENLWKALYQLRGDIIIYLDGDITNIHPRFVYGLVGPLLHHNDIGYVKSFYQRPALPDLPSQPPDGGRVTEILVRPFFALFFPELSAVIQPLAGEYAARRQILERLSFPVGYGVEVGHLIDVWATFGLGALAQTDLEERFHRRRGTGELGRMAYAILQTFRRRLQRRGILADSQPEVGALRQFEWEGGTFRPVIHTLDEQERPPLLEVAAYRARRGKGHPPEKGRGRTSPPDAARPEQAGAGKGASCV